MLCFLIKLFVIPFYKTNTGFFLFLFFLFFGTVNSGSLLYYHQSIMLSFLQSPVILAGVTICWTLYHLKATAFCLRAMNSPDGSFLYNLQILPSARQVVLLFFIYLMIFAPVILYAFIAMAYGYTKGLYGSALGIAAFLLFICCIGTYTLYRRINNWMRKRNTPSFQLLKSRPKPFVLFPAYYFLFEKKALCLSLKSLSLLLLYVALVLNRSDYSDDHFIFFYQLILLLHAVFPYLAVKFLETKLSFYRNLPVPLQRYGLVYFTTYGILFLPEFLYLLFHAKELMPLLTVFGYAGIAVATMCLLTAVQYAQYMNRKEYVKVIFAIFFVSTLALHAQAFLFWMVVQLTIAIILFWNGFHKHEGAPDA
jgi:hypothetical protein